MAEDRIGLRVGGALRIDYFMMESEMGEQLEEIGVPTPPER